MKPAVIIVFYVLAASSPFQKKKKTRAKPQDTGSPNCGNSRYYFLQLMTAY